MAKMEDSIAKIRQQLADEEAAKMAPAPMPEPVAAPAPVAAPVQAPAVEAPKSEPMSPETKQLFAQAILGLAPILAGAAVSGARGGAIGAEAGLTGLKKMESLQEAQRTRERESSKLAQEQTLKNIELALKLQGAKSEQQRTEILAEAEKRRGKEFEIEQKRKEQNDAREWSKLGLDREKLNLERQKYLADLGSSKKQLEALPPVTQDFVKKSGDEIAKKTFIANEISQAVAQFDDPKISNDQKIKIGQGLLKVLNSTQGSDAVGAEESKRLGSLLEFQILNLTQPGKVFGRDLPAFRDQAASTVNRLVDSVENVKKLSQQALSSGAIPSLQRIPLQEGKKQSVTQGFAQALPSMGQTAVAAPKPAKVIQNGVEYNLNPVTGQYE